MNQQDRGRMPGRVRSPDRRRTTSQVGVDRETGRLVGAVARRLLRIPSAPGHEHSVREEARAICHEHGLRCETDRYGNLLIRLSRARRVRPLVLAAHLDHPGFRILGRLGDKEWRAKFLGSVPEDHFRKGIPVLLMPGAVRAQLGSSLQEKEFTLRAGKDAAGIPEFAVWDLPAFSLKNGKLVARACDDSIGCASVLATLIELKRRRAKVNVIGVLSRAEEVGFYGALALAAGKTLPARALVVSLETSKEMPPVQMGAGVILRVGDKASSFDSAATRFLAEVAAELQKGDHRFQYQRALMSGGTCEATAYQEYGYQATAVCVALGNYHNCGPGKSIRAEYVNLGDVESMVRLLVQASLAMPRYHELTRKLNARLAELLGKAQEFLKPPP